MGAYTELVDFTFTANETSRTFSGLNITKDDFIKIAFTHVNGSSTISDVRLFPNTSAGVSGFDTNSNYHHQVLAANGSSTAAGRGNTNRLTRTTGSETSSNFTFFKISENGKTNTFNNRFLRNDSSLENNFEYTTSSNLTFNDPITSLTLQASETNGLGDGSRIQIYRLDVEKEADITTTSNETQVDISSLSIGKDSEYLLVSDFVDFASTGLVGLFPNDLTTITDYHSQVILGSDTTSSAERFNAPHFASNSSNRRTLAYIHIKLSEIGAFTYQSYELRDVGGTSPLVLNFFGSSTAENITSITKLNIKHTSTNGITSGTRFILYKLK